MKKEIIKYIDNHPNFTTLDITMYFANRYDTISLLLVLEDLFMYGKVSKN